MDGEWDSDACFTCNLGFTCIYCLILQAYLAVDPHSIYLIMPQRASSRFYFDSSTSPPSTSEMLLLALRELVALQKIEERLKRARKLSKESSCVTPTFVKTQKEIEIEIRIWR